MTAISMYACHIHTPALLPVLCLQPVFCWTDLRCDQGLYDSLFQHRSSIEPPS